MPCSSRLAAAALKHFAFGFDAETAFALACSAVSCPRADVTLARAIFDRELARKDRQ